MVMRMYYKVAGGHTHVRVFCGENVKGALAHCGQLTLRNEEFEALKNGQMEIDFKKEQ